MDDNGISRELIKNGVRKAADQGSAIIPPDGSERLGGPANREQAYIDASKEFIAQSGVTSLVPGISLIEVSFRVREDDEVFNHVAL
jgi:hypothetical protein